METTGRSQPATYYQKIGRKTLPVEGQFNAELSSYFMHARIDTKGQTGRVAASKKTRRFSASLE
jgi:hypothetical protein